MEGHRKANSVEKYIYGLNRWVWLGFMALVAVILGVLFFL